MTSPRIPPDPRHPPFLSPEKILTQLGIGPGLRLLEVLWRRSPYTFPLARQIAPSGLLYLLDASPEGMSGVANLNNVARMLERSPVRNIKGVKREGGRIHLPQHSVDLIFLGFTLHRIADAGTLLRALLPLAVPDGALLILEWEKGSNSHAPPKADRIGKDDAVRSCRDAGWWVERTLSLNPFCYAVAARRKH